ncbi:MAG: hypothetical protein ACRCUS_05030, partial [Anaerovoracaceae bacterium]
NDVSEDNIIYEKEDLSNGINLGPTCIVCQEPLSGSVMINKWEDGDNSDAYVRCRHCGAKNIMEGYGGD